MSLIQIVIKLLFVYASIYHTYAVRLTFIKTLSLSFFYQRPSKKNWPVFFWIVVGDLILPNTVLCYKVSVRIQFPKLVTLDDVLYCFLLWLHDAFIDKKLEAFLSANGVTFRCRWHREVYRWVDVLQQLIINVWTNNISYDCICNYCQTGYKLHAPFYIVKMCTSMYVLYYQLSSQCTHIH